jgi:hypothetical protein
MSVVSSIASPHPLDFDWPFDEPTIRTLCQLLGGRKLLALGTPSVARVLEAQKSNVLLVDRQPVQDVRNQLVADIPSLDLLDGDFEVAIADPPWGGRSYAGTAGSVPSLPDETGGVPHDTT